MNQLESITYRVNDLYELVRGLDQALCLASQCASI